MIKLEFTVNGTGLDINGVLRDIGGGAGDDVET